MTIQILPEPQEDGSVLYRAMNGKLQATGASVGMALDAISREIADDTPESERTSGMLVLVQDFRPDRFFTAEQQARLADLMARWRTARDAGTNLSAEEQSELESLVDAELLASTQRAEFLLHAQRK